MNRENKFRAWNGSQMVTVDSTRYWLGQNGCVYDMVNKTEHLWPIVQYTGLKDKNNDEIYEKDVLRICAGYVSTVEFQDGMFVSVYSHPEDGETLPLIEAIGKETEILYSVYGLEVVQ